MRIYDAGGNYKCAMRSCKIIKAAGGIRRNIPSRAGAEHCPTVRVKLFYFISLHSAPRASAALYTERWQVNITVCRFAE